MRPNVFFIHLNNILLLYYYDIKSVVSQHLFVFDSRIYIYVILVFFLLIFRSLNVTVLWRSIYIKTIKPSLGRLFLYSGGRGHLTVSYLGSKGIRQ